MYICTDAHVGVCVMYMYVCHVRTYVASEKCRCGLSEIIMGVSALVGASMKNYTVPHEKCNHCHALLACSVFLRFGGICRAIGLLGCGTWLFYQECKTQSVYAWLGGILGSRGMEFYGGAERGMRNSTPPRPRPHHHPTTPHPPRNAEHRILRPPPPA